MVHEKDLIFLDSIIGIDPNNRNFYTAKEFLAHAMALDFSDFELDFLIALLKKIWLDAPKSIGFEFFDSIDLVPAGIRLFCFLADTQIYEIQKSTLFLILYKQKILIFLRGNQDNNSNKIFNPTKIFNESIIEDKKNLMIDIAH